MLKILAFNRIAHCANKLSKVSNCNKSKSKVSGMNGKISLVTSFQSKVRSFDKTCAFWLCSLIDLLCR